jgi:hypothetical protein
LLITENSEDKNKENNILRNYSLYHNTSINDSYKKNAMFNSNYSIKSKPKLSLSNMKIISYLNEKAIKADRNKNNNLYHYSKIGNDNYIVKSNENFLRNKNTIGKIFCFDNCNSNLLNYNTFNKCYKNLLPNKKKPINFNCNNIIIKDKYSSQKQNSLKNQTSPVSDKADSFININSK